MADDKDEGRPGADEAPGTPDVPSADVPAGGEADSQDPAEIPGEQPSITDDDLAKLIASVDAAAAANAEKAEPAGRTDEQRMAQVQTLLAERTDDLQRLQAEYINYKRRVDRDRTVARQQGAESVVRELVPVLDAMHHAQQAEAELPDGVRLMMAEMARVAGNLGLETFGALGDEFDPVAYDALFQLPTSDYAPMTVAQVVQSGYRLNGTVIRPARVAVAVEPPTE
jgi:molecular chaperone GrpE